MRKVFGAALLVLASLGYLLATSPDAREWVGAAATAVVRPVVIPVVELINVPAFVYVVSLAILLSGVAACAAYRVSVLGPKLAGLRRLRSDLGELPLPRARGGRGRESWPQARHGLGDLLGAHACFVSAWAVFAAESVQAGGVPQRPFSSFLAQEPDPPSPGDEMMASLPGYFTSVGLIFTFVGLVVALYFAAKGFRTGDIDQARAAIVQLLNAASFKFLSSVSALISALGISVFARYAAARALGERVRTVQGIELYLAAWREVTGPGGADRGFAPADFLGRFDALLAGIESLSADVRRIAARADAKGRDVTA